MTTSDDRSLVATLRAAQRSNDPRRIQAVLADNPELEYADDPETRVLVAICLFFLQRGDEAAAMLDGVDAADLPPTEAWADYGLALYLTGALDDARRVLERACRAGDAGVEAFARLGVVALSQEDYGAADAAFDQALQRAPERAELLSNQAGVRFRQGRYQDAIELYDRALNLRPDLPQPREMRAKALVALDRGEELVEEARAALLRDPSVPEAHLRLAMAQSQAEDWRAAEATLTAAIDRFPDRDDLKRAFIGLLREQHAHWRLGLKLKAWVDQREEPTWLDLQLNRTRIDARLLDAAEESLDALADTPLAADPSYPVLRARILVERARAEEAVTVLEDALERFPGNVEARSLLSHTLTSLGRLEEAQAYADDMSQISPMHVVNTVAGRDGEASDLEIEQLDRLLNDPAVAADNRARVGFTLAHARDRRGEYAAAFEALRTANELARRRLDYDWRRHRRLTARQIAQITPEVVSRLDGLGWHDTRRPIFVVGMPRSGTTLTEQILCSHPDVYGAGELNWVPRLTSLMPKVVSGGKAYPEAMQALTEQNLKSAANYYLERLAEQEDASPRVVDKLPHNFDNVALIALMFPNSPIIHMDREPRDVAVSNFFQDYGSKHGLMGFAYDLRDIGHMLNDHDRIMRHWHELFPGRIYELNYQRLVAEPEETIAELLDVCGLRWDDRVMRFHETQRPVRTASIRQVRKGIYQSSAEKWRRYEAYLGPLEEVLAEGYKDPDQADPEERLESIIAGPTGLAGE